MDDSRQHDLLGGEPDAPAARPAQYLVVARRYRPQTFGELIGQEHVARTLANAITTSRVGHAYLFTGARGVGKTSAARIFAKALNCETGPTPTPCNQCDACERISAGDDVDVLEIDGASNRGIDEIRELRQNVNVRPSRSRFKIYIIDEVHMLTREAFNALLKTLEEPPEHVKFIFCTTEAEKIPITIHSRCQRYDFAGIETASIVERLRQIVAAEGVEADDAALESLARRASGSMRDSQSLLEQLLAFCSEKITVADVHRMLGTAADQRLGKLIARLVARDAAGALVEFDATLAEGVDVGQLVNQLLGHFRDVMVAAAGCQSDAFLYASEADAAPIVEAAQSLGLHTVLAAMQILDETLARMRYSMQGRTLAELALVRVAVLGDLEAIANLVSDAMCVPADHAPPPAASDRPRAVPPRGPGEQSAPSKPPSAGAKPVGRTARPERDAGPTASGGQPETASARTALAEPGDQPANGRRTSGESLTAADSLDELSEANSSQEAGEMGDLDGDADDGMPDDPTVVWKQVLAKLPDMLAQHASFAERVAISAPNCLAVAFGSQYTSCKSFCENPERLERLEKALGEVCGRPMRIRFELGETESEPRPNLPTRNQRSTNSRERLAAVAQKQIVRRAAELFGARPVAVEGAE